MRKISLRKRENQSISSHSLHARIEFSAINAHYICMTKLKNNTTHSCVHVNKMQLCEKLQVMWLELFRPWLCYLLTGFWFSKQTQKANKKYLLEFLYILSPAISVSEIMNQKPLCPDKIMKVFGFLEYGIS